MKKIHTVTWKGRFNKTGQDLSFEITEEDCYVKSVSHPIVKWMVNEPWYRCYEWLNKKLAEIKTTEE